MIRVDERSLELATRVRDTNLDTVGGTISDFFMLGGSFHAAWLTGSEICAGITPSPYDMKEYNYVKAALQRIGWEDLLDE